MAGQLLILILTQTEKKRKKPVESEDLHHLQWLHLSSLYPRSRRGQGRAQGRPRRGPPPHRRLAGSVSPRSQAGYPALLPPSLRCRGGRGSGGLVPPAAAPHAAQRGGLDIRHGRWRRSQADRRFPPRPLPPARPPPHRDRPGTGQLLPLPTSIMDDSTIPFPNPCGLLWALPLRCSEEAHLAIR